MSNTLDNTQKYSPLLSVSYTAITDRVQKINKYRQGSLGYLTCSESLRYAAHALEQMEKSNNKTGHVVFLHNSTYDSTEPRYWASKTDYNVDLEQNSRNLLRDLGYTLRILPSGNIEFWDGIGDDNK